MKIVVLVPQELALGFRLAGAETLSPDEPKEALMALMNRADVGLVIVDDSYKKVLDPRFVSELGESQRPVFVFVPLTQGVEDPRRRIEELTAQTLGYSIKVR